MELTSFLLGGVLTQFSWLLVTSPFLLWLRKTLTEFQSTVIIVETGRKKKQEANNIKPWSNIAEDTQEGPNNSDRNEDQGLNESKSYFPVR